jgi:hypothetical protein
MCRLSYWFDWYSVAFQWLINSFLSWYFGCNDVADMDPKVICMYRVAQKSLDTLCSYVLPEVSRNFCASLYVQ